MVVVLEREMYNQHKLHRICPRCGSWKARTVPSINVKGPYVNFTNGLKTTRLCCEECGLVWEEAD